MIEFNNINRIFIMLGQKCNLDCGYCLQHDLINNEIIVNNLNEDIYKFIKDLNQDNNFKPSITFYGGEPLLYFSAIKKVVKNIKGFIDNFTIITNGKKLTPEIVDYLNQEKIHVVVSWDGYGVSKSRHYDVFSEKKDIILKIDNLALNGVLSGCAYPLDYYEACIDIDKEYYNISGKRLSICNEKLMNLPKCDSIISNIDYKKFRLQMTEFCNIAKEHMLSKNFSSRYIDIFNRIACDYIKKNNCNYPACGNSISVLNLDLKGNLYNCHNTWKKIGTIYDEYTQYMESAKKNIRMKIDKDCINCDIVEMCHGSCPLFTKSDREKNKCCEYRKAYYKPVLNTLNDLVKNKFLFNDYQG